MNKGVLIPVLASILILGVFSLSQYAFADRLVVQSGDVIDGKTIIFAVLPVMNDNGDIVFLGVFDEGGTLKIGLFTPTSLLVQTGDVIDGKELVDINNPVISNNGDVIFEVAFSGGGNGLFTQTTLLFEHPFLRLTNTAVNDNGEIVFLVGDGGHPTTIRTLTTEIASTFDTVIDGKSFVNIDEPVISNNGDVVFTAVYYTPPFSFPIEGLGTFSPTSLLIPTGHVIDGKTLTAGVVQSLDDNGNIEFLEGAFIEGGSTQVGIFTPTSLLVQSGDVIDGKQLLSLGKPIRIDSGEILFFSSFSTGVTGGSGIFSLDSFLVGAGSTIDGKTLTNLASIPSINNKGDAVFRGFLPGEFPIFLYEHDIPPEQAIQNLIDEFISIVSENPGTQLADKVDDASASAQTALDEINKTPPDNQAASGNIEGAVGSLEDAIMDGGLEQTQGEQLINQLLDVSQQLAVDAINTANNTPGSDAGKISSANTALANGDSLRTAPTSFGDFKDAAAEYKVAISEAESALP